MEAAGLNNFLFYDIISWVSLILNWHFLVGMSLAFLGSIIYVVALSKGKSSIINPLAGGASYITIVILSNLLLDESITVPKTIGIIIIIIGIYLLSHFSSTKPVNTLRAQRGEGG
ncbi:MAG: EamA family transporter [Candidatus Odinarchaeum yellowstonii]|uniref:EamA family transporter n=1 Tax=Odinarchaeota yellowstonii (strain LCB_4) TaxID=1841599 RepID=A0AAF0D2J6_ODILC|nr:MAG: EamA family transporter [Candidatus Odinarchaeum yellowstonii]